MTMSVAVVVLLWIAFVIITGVAPWLSQQTAVVALHNVRDRVYLMRQRVPRTGQTIAYRLLEYISTAAIQCVRDRPVEESVAIVRMIIKAGDGAPSPPDPELEKEIDRELLDVYSDPDAARELASAMQEIYWIPILVLWRLMWSNPVMVPVVFVAMVIGLAQLVKNRRPEPPRAEIERAQRIAQTWSYPERRDRSGLSQAAAQQ